MKIAKAPGQGLFMQGFMLWMIGSGLHVISAMVTVMAIITPLKAIFSVNAGIWAIS